MEGTSITPELEARFKILVAQDPPLEDDRLLESLKESPAVEPKVFYEWFLEYIEQQVTAEFKAPPMSNTAAADLLKRTKYSDPASIFNIIGAVGDFAGIAPLPLGKFVVDSKQTYCYLSFRDMLLPNDFSYDETRADTSLTQVKADPDTKVLPRFFLELGQLCLGPAATAESSKPSQFVVVVTPDRKVFAIWNPDGVDPEFVPADEINPEAYKKRAVGGKLPGYTTACTAFQLATNIDTLCQPDQGSKALGISPSSFITVPTGTTLRFGGIDRAGWVSLDKMSIDFAAWPKYDPPPATIASAEQV